MDDDLIFNFASTSAPTQKSNSQSSKGKAKATSATPATTDPNRNSGGSRQRQQQQRATQRPLQKRPVVAAVPSHSKAPQSQPQPRPQSSTSIPSNPASSLNNAATAISTATPTSTVYPKQAQTKPKSQSQASSKIAPLSNAGPNANPTGASSSSSSNPSKPTIVSSLFTGKPKSSQSRIVTDFSNSSTPTNAPSKSGPITFKSLGLHPLLVNHLKSAMMDIGERPTEIQRKALPFLLRSELDPDSKTERLDTNRDVLIHSQTGSGKTLTYLLPVLQKLLPLCKESFINRSIGTLAIVLVPTRELARQIHEVLEKLLNLKLSDLEAVAGDESGNPGGNSEEIRRTRWIVTCLLTGGSTRNHEKARLRKGCPILVSTPGRLLDHLQNTSNLDVGKCQMLILDEADRLLELGFEETLVQILKALDGRRKIAIKGARELEAKLSKERGDSEELQEKWLSCDERELKDSTGINWWRSKRRTILCSATLDEKIQVLVGTQLRDPLLFRADGKLEKEEKAAIKVEQQDDQQNQVQVLKSTAPIDRGPENQPQQQSETEEKASPRSTSRLAEQSPNESTTVSRPSSDLVKTKASYAILPSQLSQFFVVVPPKLRLVSLIALLRSSVSGKMENTSNTKKKSTNEDESRVEMEEKTEKKRIIVFLSCTDSVDFHWKALGGASMGGPRPNEALSHAESSNGQSVDSEMTDGDDNDNDDENDEGEAEEKVTAGSPSNKSQEAKKVAIEKNKVSLQSDLLPGVNIFRLHGSLTQSERIQSLKQFSSNSNNKTDDSKCSILLATSVAARGLDLPSVSTVIQLDSPTEGGHDEYVHRIGRTARVGKIGRSILILLENERGKIDMLEKNLRVTNNEGYEVKARIKELDYKEMLRNGFGGLGWAFEERATEAQMAIEKWVLSGDQPLSLARSAFLSHLRAYSTHPSEEKHLFHPRLLHLGHLAKAFALREAPSKLGGTATKQNNQKMTAKGRKSEVDTVSASTALDNKKKRKSIEGSSLESNNKKSKFDPRSFASGLSDGVVSHFKMDGASDDEDGYDEDLKGAGGRTSTRQKLSKPVGKDAESRMYASVRALGKNTKKKGVLAAHAVDEFQIG